MSAGDNAGLVRTSKQWAGWSAFIVRPSVALTIPWVGTCSLWVMLIRIPFMRFPEDADEVARLVSSTQFGWATAINALLLGALIAEGRLAFSSPPDLKRAHLATVFLSILLLIGLQVGAYLAVQPLFA